LSTHSCTGALQIENNFTSWQNRFIGECFGDMRWALESDSGKATGEGVQLAQIQYQCVHGLLFSALCRISA